MDSTQITPRQNGKGTYTDSEGNTTKVDISTHPVGLLDFEEILSTYGPRKFRSIEFYIGSVDDPKNLVEKVDFVPPTYDYDTYYKSDTGVIFVPITLSPKIFAAWAAAFDPEKDDRKAWLKNQIAQLEESWKQYVAATSDLQTRAAKFDGQFENLNKWVGLAGGIAISTSNPYAVGAAVVVQGVLAIASIFKKKADEKAVQPYYERAEKLAGEMKEITAYYEKYKSELSRGQMAVFALIGGAILLANKK